MNGVAVYLDNWAVGDLAEGDASRRKRFIDVLCSGRADLMFSVLNAAELAGPQGKSFDLVKSFLNEVGPHWFPIEFDVFAVLQREQSGADPAASCISMDFMKAYFSNRTASHSPGSGKVIDPSEAFSGLGSLLDWVGPQRDSLREDSERLDKILKEAICSLRDEHERNPLPPSPFNASRRATFVLHNLVRTLIAESNQLKRGDGPDFSHAVMASAFASFAALDKPWKRRVEGLPKPNTLARIYSAAELDKMVTDIESCVRAPRPHRVNERAEVCAGL